MKNSAQPAQKTQQRKAVRVSIPMFDVSQLPDIDLLLYINAAHPEFLMLLAEELDAGRSEQEIIQGMCNAGAPPIAMRNTQRALRAMNAVADRLDRAEWAEAQKPPAAAP